MTGRACWRRFAANRGVPTKLLNLVRATSSKRVKFQTRVRQLLDTDPAMRRFFQGESTKLPDFYMERMRQSLGPLWDALPRAR